LNVEVPGGCDRLVTEAGNDPNNSPGIPTANTRRPNQAPAARQPAARERRRVTEQQQRTFFS
jgi:hypothetical protein